MKAQSFKAWEKSLPLGLGLPTIFWTVVALYMGESVSRMLILASGPLLIHLIAYAATGLPIFLLCHRNPASPVWMLPFALVAGPLIGGLTVFLIAPLPSFIILGAAYGFITAIAAWLQRPRQRAALNPTPPQQ